MVNILIANNDTTFSIEFINCISKLNSNIRICYIISNVEKLLEILNNENDIDIILIDSKLAFKNKQYLMQSIIYVALNPYKDLDNLEKKVYPTIAKMYNDSTHNIKCRINVETTEMYFNCNTEKLMKYFNFSVDIKPKVKTVINTILRNVL